MDDWENVGSDHDARNRIVESYLPLVGYVAAMIRPALPSHIDLDDLYSYGSIGLIEAAERYDPSRGVKFTTYATRRIRGAIIDELRSQDWAPRRVRKNGKAVARAWDALNERLQRDPTLAELANELEVSERSATFMLAELQQSRHLTLDWFGSGPGATYGDEEETYPVMVRANVDLNDHVIHADHARRVGSAVALLEDRERIVMALYYFEDMTFSQIANLLGVTESRVIQVHSSALTSLRPLAMA